MERKLKNRPDQSMVCSVLGHYHRFFTAWAASVAITLLSFSSLSYAKSVLFVDFILWQPSPKHAIFALPQVKGESQEEAVKHYLEVSMRDIDIQPFGPGPGFLNDVKADEQKFLNAQELQEKGILIAANRRENHYLNDPKLKEVYSEIKEAQRTPIILPVGATIRLDRAKQIVFHRLLAKSFSELILLGGDDLAPSTYKHTSTYSRFYNETRDDLEISLARDYYRFGKGKVLGICRGAQLLAVAFGEKLYQDINKILKSPIQHTTATDSPATFHKVTLVVPPDSAFAKLFKFDSLTQPQNQSMIWNSYHHQAVKLSPKGIFDVTAVAEDGVVEAFMSKDSRLIGVQAHFERPDPAGLGKIFLNNFLNEDPTTKQKEVQPVACTNLLKNI